MTDLVKYTESWTVDINCEKFADFNFLSSFEEIADMVTKKRCTVRYVQQNENYKARTCQPINENLIGRCNITGFQPSTTPMPTEATTPSPHGNIICSTCIYVGGVSNDIGYGKRETICFLKHSTSGIVCLIIPLTVICGCNIIFFLMTMRKISLTPKMERSSTNKATRQNSVIYIKLFSLTGITWVFEFIDAFLPKTHLSLIIWLFNALQGVFIFLSYIYNRW
ncbi:adhesion G protein-coupled receptor E2-like [Mytilus californianus]|uniref:adhesion G protein-coupled receptor E2-like n=1 Tax=Mytilus californianus TaxID=6549 RepID=UPI002245BF61|nr:adhesion G protein-coupled receptor E2-like [Mytilus californianus]